MLNISRLNHYYGARHTLWDLDLEVPRGSCTCLIGRNGVGKTTLLKCIRVYYQYTPARSS